MAISMGKTGSSEVADINMTPMIDVLLVLLVIFMIAQPLLQKTLDVQLPPDKPLEGPWTQPIVLQIASNDQYRINALPIAKAELADRLRQIYESRPQKIMFVKAESDVVYQDVIAAMDAARGAGVKVIGAVLP